MFVSNWLFQSAARRTLLLASLPTVMLLAASETSVLGFCLHQHFVSASVSRQETASKARSSVSQEAPPANAKAQSSPDPWIPNSVITPQQLAQIISDSRQRRLVIFYVGPAALYKRSHIPDAKFIGPPAQPDALKSLDQEAQKLDRHREIVIYCGCCPWNVCPNIRPAFAALHERGFKKVSVLHLPDSFRQDWVSQGFPTETKSQP